MGRVPMAFIRGATLRPAHFPAWRPAWRKDMEQHLNFYIDGAWVPPTKPGNTLDVINPATEKPIAKISLGTAADVDKAVTAARRAFETWSKTTREERIALLQKI